MFVVVFLSAATGHDTTVGRASSSGALDPWPILGQLTLKTCKTRIYNFPLNALNWVERVFGPCASGGAASLPSVTKRYIMERLKSALQQGGSLYVHTHLAFFCLHKKAKHPLTQFWCSITKSSLFMISIEKSPYKRRQSEMMHPVPVVQWVTFLKYLTSLDWILQSVMLETVRFFIWAKISHNLCVKHFTTFESAPNTGRGAESHITLPSHWVSLEARSKCIQCWSSRGKLW